MAQDKRAFAQFDVGYLDNPKMMNVLDASPTAVLMHAASILYCAQHLTDGVIALRAMQRKTGGTDGDSRVLIEEGLWHLPGHDCQTCPEVPAGKAYVHDYLQHNRSSAGVKGKSEAGSKAAKTRWAKAKAEQEADAERIAESNANRMRNPMPREREREKEVKRTPSPASPSRMFDQFWDWYPRKVGKADAVKAYVKAVKKHGEQAVIAGVERLRLDPNLPDKRFIPHPATWLNREGWNDEPYPDKNSQGQVVLQGPWSPEYHQKGVNA